MNLADRVELYQRTGMTEDDINQMERQAPRLFRWFRRALAARFVRSESVTNPADPTAVTRWTMRGNRRRFTLVITLIWEVDAVVTLFGMRLRAYNAPLFNWLAGQLDQAKYEQTVEEDDYFGGYYD